MNPDEIVKFTHLLIEYGYTEEQQGEIYGAYQIATGEV